MRVSGEGCESVLRVVRRRCGRCERCEMVLGVIPTQKNYTTISPLPPLPPPLSLFCHYFVTILSLFCLDKNHKKFKKKYQLILINSQRILKKSQNFISTHSHFSYVSFTLSFTLTPTHSHFVHTYPSSIHTLFTLFNIFTHTLFTVYSHFCLCIKFKIYT